MIILAIAGGSFWWHKHGAEMLEQGHAQQAAGRRFGQSAAANACVDEALRQHKQHGAQMTTTITEGVFLGGCLETASRVPDLCASNTDPTIMGTARWLNGICVAHGLNDSYCPNVLQPLRNRCQRASR